MKEVPFGVLPICALLRARWLSAIATSRAAALVAVCAFGAGAHREPKHRLSAALSMRARAPCWPGTHFSLTTKASAAMKIAVKTLKNKKYELDVNGSDTVSSVAWEGGGPAW